MVNSMTACQPNAEWHYVIDSTSETLLLGQQGRARQSLRALVCRTSRWDTLCAVSEVPHRHYGEQCIK